MLGLITAIVAVSASAGGYVKSRQFVRRRLRYLEGIQSLKAPLIAGVVATAVAAPVVALLPLVGAGSALLFGTAVGLGTKRGADDVREGRGGE
jgi:hypothetical protein